MRKFTPVSSCKISLNILVYKCLLLDSLLFVVGLILVVTHDYFYRLQTHQRPVNDLSTAVKLTNLLLCFWADRGFFYFKDRVCNSAG